MAIELTLLKTFLAVVDHGNFLAAANAVARSPSAITVQIKKLEDQLGKSLFIRDARTTKLTNDGELLVPHARRMLVLETNIFAEFDKTPIKGAVRLGVPDDVVERFPMQVLRRFNDEHPSVALTIIVNQTPALLKAVEAKNLDLAIITYDESIEGVSSTEKLMGEPEVWASSASGIAWEKRPLPITLWEENWSWFKPAIKNLEDAGIEYTIVLQCENISGRKAAIEADLAVGPLPISHLDDKITLAPGLQNLKKLPNYGLGLKVGNIQNNVAAEAAAEHIRNHFKTTNRLS